MKKGLILFVLFLLVIPLALAREGHMKLLAVREATDEGSAADLYLEIKPGDGRVFIETTPLTKFDTQISTRFAKDIACDYLDIDCSRYDFFYVINADAPIIGGPSAGAAISVLTASILEGVEIDEDVSITGTINSGGVIGPVGGLKAKTKAASKANIKTVLVPKGERFLKEESNLTLDLSDYAKKYNIAIVEVRDLTEALYYFTGEKFKSNSKEFEVSEDYIITMKSLAVDLCNRTENLRQEFEELEYKNFTKEFTVKKENVINLSSKGEEAFEDEAYYSAASFCFGANLKYRELLLRLNDYNDFESVEKEIKEVENGVDNISIKTISDLQTYIIVKERLKDAVNYLERAEELYEKGNYESNLAYAIERIYSARSWSAFFDTKGKEFEFDKKSLEQSCLDKISEAKERYDYAKLYFPDTLEDSKKELDDAYKDYKNKDFELCLFKGSKVKAEADLVLSVIGVAENQIDTVLENKLNIVKNVMAEQQEKDMFPILGYSYYEYANQLKDDNKISALLYAEYALELSNLDIYFNHKKGFEKITEEISIDKEKLLLFLGGIIIGVMAVFLIKKKK